MYNYTQSMALFVYMHVYYRINIYILRCLSSIYASLCMHVCMCSYKCIGLCIYLRARVHKYTYMYGFRVGQHTCTCNSLYTCTCTCKPTQVHILHMAELDICMHNDIMCTGLCLRMCMLVYVCVRLEIYFQCIS